MKLSLFKKTNESRDVFFADRLLRLDYVGRLMVRIITNSWMIVQATVTVVLLLTDVEWAFWLGMLSLLYLADWLVHFSKPAGSLLTLDKFGNLALCLSPRARRVVVSAYNKATILGGGFYLNLARVLSETKTVSEMLLRLGVDRKEFNGKLDAYLVKDLVSYRDRDRLAGEIERLAFAALENKDDDQEYIDYADLFAALGSIYNEQVNSLFKVFELTEESLLHAVPFGRVAGGAGFFRMKFRHAGDGVVTRDAFSYAVLSIERRYGVHVPYSSIKTAVSCAEKYFSGGPTPDVAKRLIERTAAYVSKRGDDIVRDEDVLEVVGGRTRA